MSPGSLVCQPLGEDADPISTVRLDEGAPTLVMRPMSAALVPARLRPSATHPSQRCPVEQQWFVPIGYKSPGSSPPPPRPAPGLLAHSTASGDERPGGAQILEEPELPFPEAPDGDPHVRLVQ